MFRQKPAPLPDVIDLRNTDALDMLASVPRGTADLVVADPPWDAYTQQANGAEPHLHYPTQSHDEIARVLAACADVLRPGGRLALWCTWPLLVEAFASDRMLPHMMTGRPWLQVAGLRWVSGGAWVKDECPPGVGYHWRGHSEPVLLAVRDGGPAGRAATMLRSGYASTPGEHSRKPVSWQRDWVEAWVDPGGLVVDPYAGLGSVTSAVALAGGGRRYVGAELSTDRYLRARAMVRREVSRALS